MKDLLQQLLTDQTLYSSISKHWHFHTLTDIHLIKSQEQYVTDFKQSAIFNQWKYTHLREDILVTTPVYLRTYKMGKPARGMWNNGRGYIQYTNIPFKEEAAVLLHSCRMLQLLYLTLQNTCTAISMSDIVPPIQTVCTGSDIFKNKFSLVYHTCACTKLAITWATISVVKPRMTETYHKSHKLEWSVYFHDFLSKV